MSSLLNVAKKAADLVLGLKSYKKYQQASMKAYRKISDAELVVTKETKFNLQSITYTFGDGTVKGTPARKALELVEEAERLLKEARGKISAAGDVMRTVNWEDKGF